MKKFRSALAYRIPLAILLISGIAFTLIGCGGDNPQSDAGSIDMSAAKAKDRERNPNSPFNQGGGSGGQSPAASKSMPDAKSPQP